MEKIIAVEKRTYPSQAHTTTEITIVLVAGAVEDYAAYIGNGSPGWIAKMGDKLSFTEACCYFGNLDREKYRD